MPSHNEWKPELYDDKLRFISVYGKDVVDLLRPQEGERILDLGCGTGDLTAQIAASGAHTEGIDKSADMIEQACRKYPTLSFEIADAENSLPNRFTSSFDAVFSNAALHWMKNADDVIRHVYSSLQPGGRFVAEFGGRDNVGTILHGISHVLSSKYGIDAAALSPWYYPTIGEYASRLEQAGFRVDYAVHFDRPTPLPDGDDGLSYWLKSFAGDFVQALPAQEQGRFFELVTEECRPFIYVQGQWVADYRRLRFSALKPG
ncbi:methyltransferase domain-containing protein [Paenibacillus sp. OSY-SE]|uniref:methyltransferase domain-containing protein n=1 Tax=Paenibacillus sp. OSY-SE TaxID=1196323 RepID=UPI0003083867|nr:methyltransferase domain-containing protein [Paenibacillus sp. OSY-SE]